MRAFIARRVLAAAIVGTTAFLTSGCTPIQPAPETPIQKTIVVPQLVCPPVKKYTDAFYTGFQSDLEKINGKYPFVEKFLVDASNLRHALEACATTQKSMREGGAQ